MTERKWTPGEWKARKKTDNEDYVHGFDWYHYSDKYGVVGYWTGHKDNHKEERWCLSEADAHLIAAAPDMYDGGEHLINWLSASLNCPSHPWDDDQRMYAEAAIEQWRFASAKARGETQ